MQTERSTTVEDEERREIKSEKKLGGTKTLPFILATEVCERFGTTGYHQNLITYLTQKMNLPLVKASNLITDFNGTAGFTPLIGALIADSFVGRFWMIIFGCVVYELGLVSIILSALLPGLRPPSCPAQVSCKEASAPQLVVVYASFLLTSIGLGGTRPCIVTFAADQIGVSKEETESRGWNFFSWYYFFLVVAEMSALIFVVYVQDNVGWGWGLAIPATSMALAIVTFIAGSSMYKKIVPKESPLIRLAQVIVAAVRKRKAVEPADPALLYNNQELDAAISSNGRLLHTQQFRWLDKAAVVSDGDLRDSKPTNLWRLSTVHRVEELKCIVRIVPIWAAGILAVTAYSHHESFSIQQARTMDRHLSKSVSIPPATMGMFENISVIFCLVLYERLFVPFARRLTGNPTGITFLQKIGIGFAINTLGTVIAALVEIKRKAVAKRHGLLDNPTALLPMSVFWLAPQYLIHGIALVFITPGRLEFFYDQTPESLRSVAASFFWIAIALGNYIGTFMVSLIHQYTSKERNWIPDRNLNRGHLENYYWFASGLQVVNLLFYLICTKFYTYKSLEVVSNGVENGGVELAATKDTSKPLCDASTKA